MAYLLDTCVIIDIVKGNTNTIQALKGKSPDLIFISTITEFELRYGIVQASKSKSKIIVEAMLSEVNILNFKSQDATKAAEIRNHLRSLGTPIGPYDFLIAATALASELILVTSNEKEFLRVPNLKIENWRS
ncbi:MAG: PIN domain-containing protein [Bacteroidota bacterium]